VAVPVRDLTDTAPRAQCVEAQCTGATPSTGERRGPPLSRYYGSGRRRRLLGRPPAPNGRFCAFSGPILEIV